MAKEKICGIYKITSPSGKIYIGLSYDILNRRKAYEKCRCCKQRKIYNSIKKHGWESHTFEIIHECHPDISKKEIEALEIYYGNKYESTSDETGLNIRKCGGSSGKHNKKTKDLIGAANKIAYSTPEMKEKCRIQNLGRKRSDETRKAMRELKKRIGKGESKYLGVSTNSYVKKGKKYIYWITSFSYKNKRLKVKRFPFTKQGEIDAALYYNEMAVKLNGKDAVLNSVSGNSRVDLKESIENERCRLVLNIQNGIFYKSATEAFNTFDIGTSSNFRAKLRGRKKNNTNFIYI